MPDRDPKHARSRNLRLTDLAWDRLEEIAREQGLDWGGVPSRSDAVRWLIESYPAPAPLDARPPPG